MDEALKRTLLSEIIALTAPPEPLGEGEFTAADLLAELRRQDPNATRSMVDRRLGLLLQRGTLTRREASQNGHPCWAYRKVLAREQ